MLLLTLWQPTEFSGVKICDRMINLVFLPWKMQ